MTIRILLVDDQAVVRKGLRMNLALQPDFAVVGEASDGVAALQQAHALRPDVVVMDIEMPRLDGIAATEALRTVRPESAVIILSIHDNITTRTQARAAGAAAFVAKQAGGEALLAAIRAAADPERKDSPTPAQ